MTLILIREMDAVLNVQLRLDTRVLLILQLAFQSVPLFVTMGLLLSLKLVMI